MNILNLSQFLCDCNVGGPGSISGQCMSFLHFLLLYMYCFYCQPQNFFKFLPLPICDNFTIQTDDGGQMVDYDTIKLHRFGHRKLQYKQNHNH